MSHGDEPTGSQQGAGGGWKSSDSALGHVKEPTTAHQTRAIADKENKLGQGM